MDLSGMTKEELVSLLTRMPGGIGFSHNDLGPAYTDRSVQQSWNTAQDNPQYDAEMERMLYDSQQNLMPSPAQQMGSPPPMPQRFRYMQEMRPGDFPTTSDGKVRMNLSDLIRHYLR